MNGFCAPNKIGPFSASDLAVIKAGHFQGAKLRSYHDAANIEQLLSVGVSFFIGMWPDFYTGDSWQAHAEHCWQTVLRQYPYTNIWQTGNEPNQPEAWENMPWQYANYLTTIVKYVEAKAEAAGMTIYYILPPLSYAPDRWPKLGRWRAAFMTRPDKDGTIPSLVEHHHYAGANSYWQYDKFLLDGSYGMNWQDVGIWTKLPVIQVEYGYSGGERQNSNMPEIHAEMANMYPFYVRECHTRGSLGSFVFQVGGENWPQFALPLVAARALSGI